MVGTLHWQIMRNRRRSSPCKRHSKLTRQLHCTLPPRFPRRLWSLLRAQKMPPASALTSSWMKMHLLLLMQRHVSQRFHTTATVIQTVTRKALGQPRCTPQQPRQQGSQVCPPQWLVM